MLSGTLARRRAECDSHGLARTMFLWEPVPPLCIPSELEGCRKALKLVQIVSPNHMELAAFFGLSANCGEDVDHEVVEKCAADWLSSGIDQDGSGAVVVRAGKDGCYMATREESAWLPAYHEASDKVTDPTGGGNTFLGGLAIALARGKGLREAAIWGSIAASFAIEQVGMPVLTEHPGGERWNGEKVQDRYDRFMRRLCNGKRFGIIGDAA